MPNTIVILLRKCINRWKDINSRPQWLHFLYYIPPIHSAWFMFRTHGNIEQTFQNLLREIWLIAYWGSWRWSFETSKGLIIIPKKGKTSKLLHWVPFTVDSMTSYLFKCVWINDFSLAICNDPHSTIADTCSIEVNSFRSLQLSSYRLGSDD